MSIHRKIETRARIVLEKSGTPDFFNIRPDYQPPMWYIPAEENIEALESK